MANLAALRAAVFSLSAKNLRGGADNRPPAVRGLTNVQHTKNTRAEGGVNLTHPGRE